MTFLPDAAQYFLEQRRAFPGNFARIPYRGRRNRRLRHDVDNLRGHSFRRLYSKLDRCPWPDAAPDQPAREPYIGAMMGLVASILAGSAEIHTVSSAAWTAPSRTNQNQGQISDDNWTDVICQSFHAASRNITKSA